MPGSVRYGGCMHEFWYGGATHYTVWRKILTVENFDESGLGKL